MPQASVFEKISDFQYLVTMDGESHQPTATRQSVDLEAAFRTRTKHIQAQDAKPGLVARGQRPALLVRRREPLETGALVRLTVESTEPQMEIIFDARVIGALENSADDLIALDPEGASEEHLGLIVSSAKTRSLPDGMGLELRAS